MEIQKKSKVAGAFVRKSDYEYGGQEYEADIKDGDRVEILNEGEVIEGQYGPQTVFSIKTRNGDKNMALNQTSQNNLIDGFGTETRLWVGKEVAVHIVKAMVSGKMQNIAYLAPQGFVMDEDGNFEPGNEGTPF